VTSIRRLRLFGIRWGLWSVPVCLWVLPLRLAAQCPDDTPPPCGHAARPSGKSLAVLPFESVGGDTGNTYFTQGLADELTTALAHVTGLQVAASSSAFTFGSGGVDAQRVGRALHVGAVLQGRVRREGTRMRVVARLTDATTGLLLWSNSYEREVGPRRSWPGLVVRFEDAERH
jgi:TolB-like protein